MFLSAKLSGVDEYVKLLTGRKSPCSQLILKNRIVFLFPYRIHLRVILAWPFRFWYWFWVVLILRVRFFTKRLDQKSGSIGFCRWEKKQCIQSDYYSFISVETTYNIDNIPEKEYHGCWQCWKFTTFIVFWTVSLRALLYRRAKWGRVLKKRYALEK